MSNKMTPPTTHPLDCILWIANQSDYSSKIGTKFVFQDYGLQFKTQLEAEAKCAQILQGKSWNKAWVGCVKFNILDQYTAAHTTGQGAEVISWEPLPESTIKAIETRRKLEEIKSLRRKLAQLESDVQTIN